MRARQLLHPLILRWCAADGCGIRLEIPVEATKPAIAGTVLLWFHGADPTLHEVPMPEIALARNTDLPSFPP